MARLALPLATGDGRIHPVLLGGEGLQHHANGHTPVAARIVVFSTVTLIQLEATWMQRPGYLTVTNVDAVMCAQVAWWASAKSTEGTGGGLQLSTCPAHSTGEPQQHRGHLLAARGRRLHQLPQLHQPQQQRGIR
jgi:hypothetical protein